MRYRHAIHASRYPRPAIRAACHRAGGRVCAAATGHHASPGRSPSSPISRPTAWPNPLIPHCAMRQYCTRLREDSTVIRTRTATRSHATHAHACTQSCHARPRTRTPLRAATPRAPRQTAQDALQATCTHDRYGTAPQCRGPQIPWYASTGGHPRSRLGTFPGTCLRSRMCTPTVTVCMATWRLAVWKLAACGEEGSGARHGIGGDGMQGYAWRM